MHASIYNIYPNKATSYTVCITGPRHEQTKWIHLPASRVESESKYFPSSGMLHTHLPSFTIYCTSSRCKSRTGECECWSESSAPHCLSNSPSRSHQEQVQVLLFSKFILYHQVVLQTISFSKMQCNANIRWQCFFRQEVQGIDSEDKITTWS